MNGAAIKRRRRRRLRLTAGATGCFPFGASPATEAETGGEPPESGGAVTSEPEPDRRSSFIPPRPSQTEITESDIQVAERYTPSRRASNIRCSAVEAMARRERGTEWVGTVAVKVARCRE